MVSQIYTSDFHTMHFRYTQINNMYKFLYSINTYTKWSTQIQMIIILLIITDAHNSRRLKRKTFKHYTGLNSNQQKMSENFQLYRHLVMLVNCIFEIIKIINVVLVSFIVISWEFLSFKIDNNLYYTFKHPIF